ncbi:MAG: DUF1800 family protein [Verrucomicrobiota bacterium]
MPFTYKEIPALALWEPIHRDDWGTAEARHFLERAGFASHPEAIEEVLDLGPAKTCERFFPRSEFVIPEWIDESIATSEKIASDAKAAEDKEERNRLYREKRQHDQEAVLLLEHEWLLRAAMPETGFRAKWELFLSDVWVVGKRTVRYPKWLTSYWQSLASLSDVPYPKFCKLFSREPAMVRYLDLNRNSKSKPNENFARELFELFTLGEGNYTEADIKEAARAFTGRRLYGNRYLEVKKHFDGGRKTVFEQTGNWDGDQIIDLIFEKPAARVFLPNEAIRFYLTHEELDPRRLAVLGGLWAEEDFRLDALRRRLFSSRAFYALDFRGNRIKSPVELYIGSLQRFGLQPIPMPRYSTRHLRAMGQELFEPPNVRGWIGGEAWINAGKLAARRQAIAELFQDFSEKSLNADDQYRIDRERGRQDHLSFRVDIDRLVERIGPTNNDFIQFVNDQILINPPGPTFFRRVRDHLGNKAHPAEVREVLVTILQSPHYQLS